MTFEEQLGAHVLHEIECDDEPQPYELGCAITGAYAKDSTLVDEMLIALCGWSYMTLTEQLNGRSG